MHTAATLAMPPAAMRLRSSKPRRAGWWLLLLAVLLGHALGTLWLQDNLVGWGDGGKPMPQRIEVAFVRTLAPAAPPPPPAMSAQRAPRKGTKAKPVVPAASAPAEPVPPPVEPVAPPVEPVAPPVEPTPVIEVASTPPPPAAVIETLPVAEAAPASAAASAASAPAAPAFEWPPSTRLTYTLKGNYRGEVHGNARVQWVRLGSRYQVHLDVTIGPSFAPLISRRMTSDGELGDKGLVPQRYDEATRLPFQQARRASLQFTPEQITLPNGSQQATLPSVQDSASQFVQLTWLFTTRPELLRAGNTVTLALALPRRVGHWTYDVLGEERLATPIGEIDTFHLRPRLGERRPGNELSAEVWFAPTLQYLPVRIRIQQNEDTFVDLMLDAAPLQAAPEAGTR